MKVPLLDLKAQYATIRDQVQVCRVAEVLDSQICIGGPKVAELEQKVAALSAIASMRWAFPAAPMRSCAA